MNVNSQIKDNKLHDLSFYPWKIKGVGYWKLGKSSWHYLTCSPVETSFALGILARITLKGQAVSFLK